MSPFLPLTSLTDERGVVTDLTVGTVTGGITQRIDDATGMALITDLTLDNLGRATQALGPSQSVGGENGGENGSERFVVHGSVPRVSAAL